MLFAVLFTDRPDQGALRATHLQATLIGWLHIRRKCVWRAVCASSLGRCPKVLYGSLSLRPKKASIN